MVDLSGTHGTISANDFIFKVGNNNSPSTWATAPSPLTVSTRPGAGAGSSDRVELVWADNAIQKQWLEIVVKGNDTLGGSNANTGLAGSYVFFYGSAPGDDGNMPDDASTFRTTASDEIDARLNPKTLLNNIPLTFIYDYDKDGKVDSNDQIVARSNGTTNINAAKPSTSAAPGRFVVDAGPVASPAMAPTGSPGDAGSGADAGIATAIAGQRRCKRQFVQVDCDFVAPKQPGALAVAEPCRCLRAAIG